MKRIKQAALSLLLLLCLLLVKPIGAYQFGEHYAASMGVNVRRFRAALIGLSCLLAACVTALVGPISFVGIAVPYMTKKLLLQVIHNNLINSFPLSYSILLAKPFQIIVQKILICFIAALTIALIQFVIHQPMYRHSKAYCTQIRICKMK